MGLTGPKSRAGPFRGSRGGPVSWPFPVASSHPQSLTCGPFLHLQSQQCCISLGLSAIVPSGRSPAPLPLLGPCGHIGPTWLTQDEPPILRSDDKHLNSMCSLSPPLPHNAFAGPGVRAWTSGGCGWALSCRPQGDGRTCSFSRGPGPLTRSSASGLGGTARARTSSLHHRRRVCMVCTVIRLGGLLEKSCPPS